jgi:hypothetical protein
MTRTSAAHTLGMWRVSARAMAVLPNPQALSPAARAPCPAATATIMSHR